MRVSGDPSHHVTISSAGRRHAGRHTVISRKVRACCLLPTSRGDEMDAC